VLPEARKRSVVWACEVRAASVGTPAPCYKLKFKTWACNSINLLAVLYGSKIWFFYT
jgi:hypothetical protein